MVAVTTSRVYKTVPTLLILVLIGIMEENGMSQVSSKLTMALAGVALMSLPVLAGPQSTAQEKPKPASSTAQDTRQTSDQDQKSPQFHLNKAKAALNSIQMNSPSGDTRTQLTEIRAHFTQLENAWKAKAAASARSSAGTTGHAGGHMGTPPASTAGATSGTPAGATAGTTGTPEQTGATGATTRQTPRSGAAAGMSGESDNWMVHYQAIDSMLDRLLDNTSASAGASAGATATEKPAATAGTAGTSATATLDARTRAKLADFRKHLEDFHSAAMAQEKVSQDASASTRSTMPESMTEQTPPSPEPSAATTATQSSSTAAQTYPSSTTQASSGSVDRATIARLVAQIDELTGSASTSSTSSTAGAVGTTGATGSAGGTVCVDRAKLEQLKRDLQALQNQGR